MLTNTPKTLIFIDPTVADPETLAQGAIPGARAIILKGDTHGLEQITETLANYTDLESVHLISHGDSGRLCFAKGQLDLNNIGEYGALLGQWRGAVPSLLLYGCNVAQGARGVEFIEKLHQLTGAKVAASATRTGCKELGGDWELETTSHPMGVSLAFEPGVMAGYGGGFPVGANENVISTNANDAHSVFAADADGDGDVDVFSASRFDDKIAVYLNDGSNNYTEQVISTNANGAYSVFAADADGDGDVDVFSASLYDDKIAVYLNDGSNNYTEQVISTNASAAFSVFAADADGDGDVDVFSASVGDDKIAVYLNDGSNNYTEQVISTNADYAFSVFAADADGDGDVDVFSASRNDDKIAVYLNDGSNNYTEQVISNTADNARSVFAADADGDGDVDVFSASANDNKIAVYLNDGSNNYTEQVISTNADYAQSVFAADADGDGDVDVFSASLSDDKIAVYLNDGSNNYTEQVISNTADVAYSVFAADADGDGDVDVFSASYTDDKIAWYETVSVPELTNLDPATFTESAVNAAAQIIDSDILLTSESNDLNGGSVTVTYSIGGGAEDQLTVANVGTGAGQIGFDGSNVTYQGNIIGSVDGTNNGVNGVGLQINLTTANATPTAADALIQALSYQNTSENPTASRTISITINEGAGESTPQTAEITVTAENDAPVLDNTLDATGATADIALSPVDEDSAVPTGAVGSLVSNIVALTNNVTDADTGAVTGIALTATDTTNGTWHYSTNGGTNWNAVGAVSDTSALLLAADANTRLYFQATTADYNGAIANAITFRAWDQSSGSPGTTANTSVNGDTTAFSTATDTASIAVNAVNDDPVITAPASATVLEDTATAISGISLADTDSDPNNITVTLSVGAGTINVADAVAGGLAAGNITNNGTATVTLTGTVAAINTTLADASGLTYTTATDDETAKTLTITANDGGNTGSGGGLDVVATVPLTVTNNDIDHTTAAVAATFNESDGTSSIFTIDRTGATDQPSSIDIAFSGTADEAIDYNNITATGTGVSLTGNTVSFAAGATQATVAVDIIDDQEDEGTGQDIVLTLSNASASGGYVANIATATDTITILDDDTAGVTVGTISGNTGEDGTAATFTVVLDSEPTANVTIPVSSSDTTEGTPNVSSLTFTAANWNAAQTVTITGVDDSVDDNDIAYNIVLDAATSSDPNYNSFDAADVAVNNIDNDTTGVTVGAISGNTGEDGTTATFTVVLDSEPTADVVIPVSSDDTSEGTPNVSSLTFTAANWNAAQTVTITGVDDSVDDDNIAYNVVLGTATSTDTKYSGINPADVAVTNIDNDTTGITVGTISGNTGEDGTAATFTVVLDSEPTADVVIPVSSSDTTEGTPNVSSLTFTAANWNAAQTVTVTGVNDNVDDDNIAYNILLDAATSSDANYSAFDAADVAVTNIDNDTTGITVGTISGNTGEDGTAATFTVVLDSEPTADVVIPVSSDDTTEGTLGITDLTFTAANWNAAQTVTITGVDDSVDDNDIAYNIVLGAATSTDTKYSGINPADVAVTNIDNDTTGITVGTISGNTGEDGTAATFTVVLDSEPTADVTIPVSSSDTTEGTTDVTDLTFTAANWNAAQTVTITGVDDSVDDNDIAYNIVLGAATSSDPNYNSFDAADVATTNIDNDTTGITVGAISGNTDETGTAATFTVVLDSEPTADVAIPVSSSDTTEGTVDVSQLAFTAANWNLAQTVTITGVDDSVDDNDIAYNIVLDAATSSDPNYNSFDAADVAVTNIDNDTTGITVGTISGNTDETGTAATFTVVLDSEPTADVVIPVSSSDTTEGTPNVSSLTFTAANWNAAQTVTVTGVNDNVDDDNIAYNILLDAATSSDANYSAIDAADVAVTNIDNDTTGVTVGTISGNTDETGTAATFTVVLDSEPTADVAIPVSSSDTTEGTVDVSQLAFTAANWNAAQTVTITGVDDSVDDNDIAYNIVLGAATSSDANYSAIDAADVATTNIDNDTTGITVGTISGNTDETGTAATFTVVLDSEPTADVAIPVSSSDTTEGTVDVSQLAFTAANWNAAQTVTITGVDDSVDDNDIAYNIVLGAATSSDANYSAIDAADVAVTNIDNDTTGVTVGTISGNTDETGTAATFTVVLDSEPTADVAIPVSSSDTTEGTVDVSQLAFTAANWNAAQTVTITGVDDSVDDNDIAYNIVLGAATSSDANYSAIDAADVATTNIDNDTTGITVGTISGNTDETGTAATFTVVLDSEPTADVVIPVSSSDTTEGTVDVSQLAFTAANWNAAQTVTITGVDDSVDDNDIAYNIVLGAATSSDANYSAIDAADVAATNVDNDTTGITVGTISGNTSEDGTTETFTVVLDSGNTDETGTAATFTVVLDSEPTADVAIPVSSSDTTEGTVDVSQLAFTAANWNLAQTVTITGVDDSVDDNDIAYNIVLGAATSSDANYSAIDAADVAATNIDNDTTGVTVGTISGNTDETGTAATFTVVLDSEPTADVAIPVSSSDTTEGTVDVSQLAFTAANWNAAQTVTITGVDDSVDDNDIAYNIVLGAATSSDANYLGVDAADVAVNNIDNDTTGITVGTISGNTSEDGTTATFTVVLDSEPTADVAIPVSSSDTTEGTTDVTDLTFTALNWNTAQTVTVTGVDDNVDDNNIAYNILLNAATSSDPNYSAIDAADVAVTNIDNDTTGITVGTISGNTSEDGTTETFTVVLDSEPTADVAIPVSSSDTTEGIVDVSQLTFTAADWNAAQTVTVTGVDDNVDDDNQTYTIELGAATSSDPNYSGIDATNVVVTNIDEDTASIGVSPISNNTSEDETNGTFTVFLNSQPTADVTIDLNSSNTAEGTVDVNQLTFTDTNWETAQTVTVTGVDDSVADGDINYSIVLNPAVSIDPNYSDFDASDINITNEDNDAVGITVSPISNNTSEDGTSGNFTVFLNSQPTADVLIPVSSSDTTEGTVDQTQLTFTAANWNATQTVTVTGVDDNLDDSDSPYNIVLDAAASSDSNYSDFDASDITITNEDNDTTGIIVSPISNNTSEDGTSGNFTVVLGSQPTADVTIDLNSDNTAEGTVDKNQLTFTDTNWETAQTVTVTGVDDSVADGDVNYSIALNPAVSTDANYSDFDASDINITNEDNDTTGIIVSPISNNTSEDGTTGTFTVVLGSQPTADVTIDLNSDNTAEGTVDKNQLTFTPDNWETAQTVTVAGVDDLVSDGDVNYSIALNPAVSTDANYSDFDASDINITNEDNDTTGVIVSPISNNTTEDGTTATFTVVLGSQPTGDVTVDLNSNNTAEGTVDKNQLTFTPDNWETAQTVTVAGVDDLVSDGDVNYSIALNPAVSTDANYSDFDASDINITNEDNDTTGVIVSPISNNTTEDGTTATFTVVLGSQPTGDVTVDLNSNNTAEGTVDKNQLTFTPDNWETAQTVTVAGVDDLVSDGDVNYSIALNPAVSTDANYSDFDASDINITNEDNDTTGVIVSPISNNTSEDGTTATFTVVLGSQPTGDVTVELSASDTTEGNLDRTGLTFTSDNWDTPQTVTVTGLDDDLADGDILYNILTAATSSDPNYSAVEVGDVSVTNLDNETTGITVSPISNNTSETGTAGTFNIVLNSQPTADVTIDLSSDNTAEGTVDKNQLTFTADNWELPQTVTVTGVNDDFADGPVTYNIITAAAVSEDVEYSGLNVNDIAVNNLDDELEFGIIVGSISDNTSEDGTTAAFTVVLASQPTGDVTVPLSSNDTTEGSIDKDSLTFTADNWDTAQTVTVTPADDLIDDGDITYTIVTAAATSSDTDYSGLDATDVAVINSDNDNSGITLTPISNNTSEDGTTGTFSVALKSQPTADVTFNILSDTPEEGTVDKPQLTFTAENWNTPQTVTITGVDDELSDGEVEYGIGLTTTSSDANYSELTNQVTLSNSDNDNSGITLTPISNNTSEDGTTGTFSVALKSQPTADVTFNILSDTPEEGTVDKPQLTFTAENWNTPQTVTITGVDDELSDGEVEYGIGLTTTSSDVNYEGLTSEVSLTNTDNDNSGITLTPISNNTSEDGTTGTFSVALKSQPTADVTFNILSDTPEEGTVDKPQLTFTAENWNTPQTVTITGVDDELSDGEVEYGIGLTTTSSDVNYSELTSQVTLSNTDNDNSGITLTPISNNTSEDGTTGTFSVALKSQPTADVTFSILSDTPEEGTVDKPQLTFTAENWNTPQTVTITGVDDELSDGEVEYGIGLTTTSSDVNYSELTSQVTLSNTDNDNSGITLTPISNNTSEDGTTGTFSVALKSQPTADVTFSILSDTPEEGTVDKPQLTFTAENWNTPQTVTITGVDDELSDGEVEYGIGLTTTSSDANYSELTNQVPLTNTDNDNSGVTVTPVTNNTSEDGTTGTFTVALKSQPTADVTFNILSDTPTEGTVDKPQLTFTAENWNTPQTVTITGVDDELSDGEVEYGIGLTTTSSDANYSELTNQVSLTNTDNDNSGVTVTPITNNTSEDGTTGTFTVALKSQPTADVTFNILSDTPTEGTVDKPQLTFTAENWNTPQTVTITGVDDELSDGEVEYGIGLTTTSSDANYSELTNQVTLSNTDNDNSGVTVTPVTNNTSEDGTTGTFTVALKSQPTADVTFNILSDTPEEGTVDKPQLTFTAENWNTPQTVTITGVDDELADGEVEYAISIVADSKDDRYIGLEETVTVTNLDNEEPEVEEPTAGLEVSDISNETSEDGTAATFEVALTSQPASKVTIEINNENPEEGKVNKKQLVFTPENWDRPKTVRVKGKDDELADGDVEYNISLVADSKDEEYAELEETVTVTNLDNEEPEVEEPTAGLEVSDISNETSEDGTAATFEVVLTSQPTSKVTIEINNENPEEGKVNKKQLVFTPENWDRPKTVRVKGKDDELADGDVEYNISLVADSKDEEYAELEETVTVTNLDNEEPEVEEPEVEEPEVEEPEVEEPEVEEPTDEEPEVEEPVDEEPEVEEPEVEEPEVEEPTDEEPTDEEPEVEEPTDEEPTDEEPTDEEPTDEEPTDEEPTDEEPTDEEPEVEEPTDEEPTDEEPEVEEPPAGLEVSDISNETSEDGTPATLEVALTSQPQSEVTIDIASDTPSEGTVDVSSLTFSAENWDTPQTVTVTGANDFVVDGDVEYNISLVASSKDEEYAELEDTVTVTNLDNDVAQVNLVIPSLGLKVLEGYGSDVYKVVLKSKPTADVTIAMTVDEQVKQQLGNETVEELVFTPDNWNVPKTVSVVAVNDENVEGKHTGEISYSVSSEDADYDKISVDNVTVEIGDNDEEAEQTRLNNNSSIVSFADSENDKEVEGSKIRDVLYSGSGNNVLTGKAGSDILFAESGDDGVDGGPGNDFLSGGEGDDNINGSGGNDVVYGSSGEDRIFGGGGDDMLFGESDNDYIKGDGGADTLTGGGGNDAFAIDIQTGITSLDELNEVDFITDFDPAEDRIDLGSLTFENIDLIEGTADYAGFTLVQGSESQEYLAVLKNVVPDDLQGDNFV